MTKNDKDYIDRETDKLIPQVVDVMTHYSDRSGIAYEVGARVERLLIQRFLLNAAGVFDENDETPMANVIRGLAKGVREEVHISVGKDKLQ